MKIATQRRDESRYVVTNYYVKVKASDDADGDFTAVCGTDSCPQLFTGNERTADADDVVTNEFDWPIAARFVRLNPRSVYAGNCTDVTASSDRSNVTTVACRRRHGTFLVINYIETNIGYATVYAFF